MSRFSGPRGKIVRRFGINIFGNRKFDKLKEKRAAGPGQHGAQQGRKKPSEYSQQLQEKQKLKFTYGLREKQFRVVFARAARQKGVTGDNLMVQLEARLDNVVFRLGMAPTRDAARQLVTHGHIKINGRRTNIGSCAVRANDVISVKDSVHSRNLVQRHLEESSSREVPSWLMQDKTTLTGTVLRLPLRPEIPSIADETRVVELYSK